MSAILMTAPTKQQQSEPLAGVHFMMQTPSCLVPCQLCYSVRAMKMYELQEESRHMPGTLDEVAKVDDDADNESNGSARKGASPKPY